MKGTLAETGDAVESIIQANFSMHILASSKTFS